MLLIVIGLPGTGKSTVSKYLAERFNAKILNADKFRQKLFKIDPEQKDQIFPKSQRDAPYHAIFLEAKKLIKAGHKIIIDAALYSNKLVSEARSICQNSKVLQVVCPENLVKKRLEKRMNSTPYSAGIKVHEFMKSITENISDVDLVIDTSSDWKKLLEEKLP